MTDKKGWREWAVQRFDSWFNALTGLSGGESGNGLASRLGFQFIGNARLADQVLEDAYHNDWIVAAVCDAIPDDATRQGFILASDGDEADEALVARMQKRMLAMHALERAGEAWTWARLYGGGALLLGIDDGQEMDQPLDEDNIRSFGFVTVLDRRECLAVKFFRDPISPHFGLPEIYQLARVTQGGTETARVHASRLVTFGGVRTSRRKRMENSSWGQGVVQRCWDAIRQFQAAWVAAGMLMQNASQDVFAIKDLAGLMAEDSSDALKARLQAISMSKSVANALIIDADGERYERNESAVLTGLPPVLQQYAVNLAASTRIPVPRLFGESPAGLNATGDNTIRTYYDYVRAAQVNELQPKLERIIRLLWRSQDGPSSGVVPKHWRLEWKPLWQPTDAEVADLRLKVSQADVAYIGAGVLTPEEVAVSRFGKAGWSADTTVDLEARIAAMAADRAGGDEPALGNDTPEPAPAPGPDPVPPPAKPAPQVRT